MTSIVQPEVINNARRDVTALAGTIKAVDMIEVNDSTSYQNADELLITVRQAKKRAEGKLERQRRENEEKQRKLQEEARLKAIAEQNAKTEPMRRKLAAQREALESQAEEVQQDTITLAPVKA